MKTCCKLALNYALAFSLMNLTTFKFMKANADDSIVNTTSQNEQNATSDDKDAKLQDNLKDNQQTAKFDNNKVTKIKNLNQLAELEFLNADLSKAYSTYESVSHLALDSLWPESVRQIIFQSFFRMAQIKKSEQQALISKAVVFAYDLEPNKETTPPQLYKLFQEIKNDPVFVTVNFDPTKKLRINGSTQIVKVHKDKIYRLDSILEDTKPVTDFVVGSKISSYTPRLKKASLNLASELPTKLPLKLTPTITDSEPLNFTANSDFNTTTKVKSKNNRKWIYIASSVLAVTLGAMLINQSNDSSDSYEPTSKQGF